MFDWLSLPFTHKVQAIDEQRRLIERSQSRRQHQAEQLHAGHIQILDAVQTTGVETLLRQLAETVIVHHPRYPTAHLHRKIEYQIEPELAYVDAFVNDPWQGCLWDARGPSKTIQLLPARPSLPRGFFITQVNWHFHLFEKLELDYRVAHVLIAIQTRQQLLINDHAVQPLDQAATQRALVKALNHPQTVKHF